MPKFSKQVFFLLPLAFRTFASMPNLKVVIQRAVDLVAADSNGTSRSSLGH